VRAHLLLLVSLIVHVTGAIPAAIGDLVNLQTLDLQDNALEGTSSMWATSLEVRLEALGLGVLVCTAHSNTYLSLYAQGASQNQFPSCRTSDHSISSQMNSDVRVACVAIAASCDATVMNSICCSGKPSTETTATRVLYRLRLAATAEAIWQSDTQCLHGESARRGAVQSWC
jgi:hypothetical protein